MLMNWKEQPDRDNKYLAFIRTLPCCVCGTTPCDAHHVDTGGMGTKASDYCSIPLCRLQHGECHTIGKESFQRKYRIDFKEVQNECLKKFIRKERGNEHSFGFQ